MRQRNGFTLVAMLVLVALISLGLAAVGPLWSQQIKREREQDLLRLGALYAQAIADFREASPGVDKRYPQDLQMLLLDERHLGIRRHLRQLYADPVGGGQPWGLIRDAEQGIVGVYSRSQDAPLAQGAVMVGRVKLDPAQRYSDWKFLVK
jgi:type II secretory pathway pseudopilin PulG